MAEAPAMRFCVFVLGLLLLTKAVSFGQQSEDPMVKKFEEAEQRIVRLPPTDFPELPPNIVRELQRRGCEIPQDELLAPKPNNVIKGEFLRPGQTDWAVLCSVKGVSSILVFWNSFERNPASIGSDQDRSYLEGEARGIIFSRLIRTVGKEFIVNVHRDEGITIPPVNHQGILDAFADKIAGTWYFDGEKWRIL
jgi:hypothetical protein